jgi:cellulose synthase/poly-beta-1,6-N-acetylglucosamine synthase-like glycosyltransferase
MTTAFWMAGALIFRLFDERTDASRAPTEGWPAAMVLIPAYSEEEVIESCVTAALADDYPQLEVFVLDDGSTDPLRSHPLPLCGSGRYVSTRS